MKGREGPPQGGTRSEEPGEGGERAKRCRHKVLATGKSPRGRGVPQLELENSGTAQGRRCCPSELGCCGSSAGDSAEEGPQEPLRSSKRQERSLYKGLERLDTGKGFTLPEGGF